jgi:hypothetical protein
MSDAFGKERFGYEIEPVDGYGVGLAVGLGLGELDPQHPPQSEARVAEIASAVMAATRARILIMAPATESLIFGMSIDCRLIETLDQSR